MPEKNEGCTREDCPGEEGLDVGYGFAGGGLGVYSYCLTCGAIVAKSQDPEEDA